MLPSVKEAKLSATDMVGARWGWHFYLSTGVGCEAPPLAVSQVVQKSTRCRREPISKLPQSVVVAPAAKGQVFLVGEAVLHLMTWVLMSD